MARSRLHRLAEHWEPDPDDPYGADKSRLVRFLLNREVTSENPISIAEALRRTRLDAKYRSKEAFQHRILGPLRRDPSVFVGTSNRGIYLVLTPEDADTTLGFYTTRIGAELRHARNLRTLAKRTALFDNYRAAPSDDKERAVIYIDESGSPAIEDRRPPVFVVAAVAIGSKQDVSGLNQRFENALATIGRPKDQELKTSRLSLSKHQRVLSELSLLNYQWAAACFDKRLLDSPAFRAPKTFYKYAFQFLVGDLLTIAWQADLVIDESSTPAFQRELEAHLRRQNSGLPVHRLHSIRFAQSNRERLVQLADLVAGAVRRSVGGEPGPLKEIEHQMINLQFWPPR